MIRDQLQTLQLNRAGCATWSRHASVGYIVIPESGNLMCSSLRRVWRAVCVLCIVGAALSLPNDVSAGSARDYLNAPIDGWLASYNVGYAASVTPEDGLDVTAPIRTNVASQSLVL